MAAAVRVVVRTRVLLAKSGGGAGQRSQRFSRSATQRSRPVDPSARSRPLPPSRTSAAARPLSTSPRPGRRRRAPRRRRAVVPVAADGRRRRGRRPCRGRRPTDQPVVAVGDRGGSPARRRRASMRRPRAAGTVGLEDVVVLPGERVVAAGHRVISVAVAGRTTARSLSPESPGHGDARCHQRTGVVDAGRGRGDVDGRSIVGGEVDRERPVCVAATSRSSPPAPRSMRAARPVIVAGSRVDGRRRRAPERDASVGVPTGARGRGVSSPSVPR